jgi:periplasmic protein TonB
MTCLLSVEEGPENAAKRPVGRALTISVFAHVVALIVVAIVISRFPKEPQHATRATQPIAYIAVIAQPSQPGDLSGGSGNRTPAPARPMQRPGVDAVALPTRPLSHSTRIDTAPDPEPLTLPAVPTAAGIRDTPGVITTLTSAALDSDGPGSGNGPGSGRGSGAGPGDGPGVGEGYRVGNGVTSPRLLREVKPGYTGEAMRARIQGVVRLQAIVLPDGSVGNMKVVRSLDHLFGLDEEAMKSVSQWRFQPGTLAGRAVPVLIEVELAFTLR